MKDRAYDIMKELVELRDREKVLQDELKKIFDEENDIKVCIEAADNIKNNFEIAMQLAETIENERKQKEEVIKEDPCKKCDYEPKYSCTGCENKINYEKKNKKETLNDV